MFFSKIIGMAEYKSDSGIEPERYCYALYKHNQIYLRNTNKKLKFKKWFDIAKLPFTLKIFKTYYDIPIKSNIPETNEIMYRNTLILDKPIRVHLLEPCVILYLFLKRLIGFKITNDVANVIYYVSQNSNIVYRLSFFNYMSQYIMVDVLGLFEEYGNCDPIGIAENFVKCSRQLYTDDIVDIQHMDEINQDIENIHKIAGPFCNLSFNISTYDKKQSNISELDFSRLTSLVKHYDRLCYTGRLIDDFDFQKIKTIKVPGYDLAYFTQMNKTFPVCLSVNFCMLDLTNLHSDIAHYKQSKKKQENEQTIEDILLRGNYFFNVLQENMDKLLMFVLVNEKYKYLREALLYENVLQEEKSMTIDEMKKDYAKKLFMGKKGNYLIPIKD